MEQLQRTLHGIVWKYALTLLKQRTSADVGASANDVNRSYQLNTTDQPNGAALHARDFDSYFATVERLYDAGARSFIFNGILPFDRAQTGILQGPQLQAQLAVNLFRGQVHRVRISSHATYRHT